MVANRVSFKNSRLMATAPAALPVFFKKVLRVCPLPEVFMGSDLDRFIPANEDDNDNSSLSSRLRGGQRTPSVSSHIHEEARQFPKGAGAKEDSCQISRIGEPGRAILKAILISAQCHWMVLTQFGTQAVIRNLHCLASMMKCRLCPETPASRRFALRVFYSKGRSRLRAPTRSRGRVHYCVAYVHSFLPISRIAGTSSGRRNLSFTSRSAASP